MRNLLLRPSAGISLQVNSCGIDFTQDSEFLPVLYGIFFIFGLPLNLMALYGLYRLIKSGNVLPVFVINLLLSDLLQLLSLPFWMDYYSENHKWRFGPQACHVMGPVFYISIYVGIFSMCLIALERHFAIARPLQFQRLRSLKCSVAVAIGLWVVITVPPYVGYDVFFPIKSNSTLCFEKYPSEGNYIIYRLITLVLSFILPLSFIITLHIMTIRSMAGITALGRGKTRVRMFLNLLSANFVVVLGPYHLTGCIKYIGLFFYQPSCEWEKALFVPYQLGRGLVSLNSLLDPVLYLFLRSDFKEAWTKYLPCLHKVLHNSKQDQPSQEGPTCSRTDV